jgi:hypothetical protein
MLRSYAYPVDGSKAAVRLSAKSHFKPNVGLRYRDLESGRAASRPADPPKYCVTMSRPRSELPGKANQRNILAHLHDRGVLDLDMGCSAAPEGGDETPILGAGSGENELAPSAVVPVLAVLGREDPGKKPLSAAINPDGQFRPRIADLMGNYAKSFSTPGVEGECYISSRGIARHELRGLPGFADGRRQRHGAGDERGSDEMSDHYFIPSVREERQANGPGARPRLGF